MAGSTHLRHGTAPRTQLMARRAKWVSLAVAGGITLTTAFVAIEHAFEALHEVAQDQLSHTFRPDNWNHGKTAAPL